MIRIMKLSALFVAAMGCSSVKSFEIDSINYKLSNNSGLCQLEIPRSNTTIALKIPYPCDVHVDKNKSIRIFDNKGQKYIIIEHSIPHPVLPGDCQTSLQSIVITEEHTKASEYIDVVASCPPYQWDTKVFKGLFRD